jgi:NAD(P)-dependent dehydrogenase (short-subunit alcohol dehydrogenase family)
VRGAPRHRPPWPDREEEAPLKELRGRVAVVTGGASGIGLAMARRFGEEGMRVVHGIREERFWMLPASERSDASIRARAQSMLERLNPDYVVEKRPPAAGGLARD